MEERIKAIEERNRNVEAEKAWEISTFRKVSIAVITYFIASAVLFVIGVSEFYLAAIVPVVGYLLSTQSLPTLKRKWIEKYHTKTK